VTPKESLHRDYSLLSRFLRSIALRLQFRATLELLLLLCSGIILILLGSLSAFELRESFPYLPFIYSLLAILALSFLLLLGFRRVFSKPSREHVARALEERFPRLRDDVTNSLLLFDEIKESSGPGRVSEGLISAQLKKTAGEISAIKAPQVVSLKTALRHLRILLPLVIAFSAVLALDPHFLNRSLALILHPLSGLPAKETAISLEPKGAIVLRNTPLVISAQATGNIPDKLFLTIWPEEGEPARLQMDGEGNGKFLYRIASTLSSFRYQASNGGVTTPTYTIQVVDPPDVKKVKLTLTPPDYSGLREEMKEEGNIEALMGTAVNLEAQATKSVKEGKIILNQESELLLKASGDSLKGSLLVLSPGSYSIKLKDEHGFENPNPVQYQIRLVPDKYPEAEIVSPAKDLEITGNEIIPIIYTARDDFGITAIKLNYQMGGMERSISLKSMKGGRSLDPEAFKWDLASLTLTAGDRVVYRIEVWDNDAVSGPKVGYSRSFSLSVRDERARAAREGEEAQQIADALLDLLADQLETVRDREGLKKGMEEILGRVEKNLDQMGERVERFDLEALKRNLSSLKDRIPVEPQEKVTREMERLALLAEDIAKRARMNEVEALAREMRNRQRRLVEAMSQLKERFTREGLEAAMKELKKVEELLRSVMDALSKLAAALPDEFINSQELSGLDFQDLFKDLEEMQKRLAAGDIAGALEAAQRLLQALSEMMASLGRARSQAGMSPFDRLQGEMARQSSELDKIVAEQRGILRETEGVGREIKQRTEEEVGKRLASEMPRLKEVLDKLKRSLPQEQGDLMEELERLLGRGNLERFSEMTQELEKTLSRRADVDEFLRELRGMMERLVPESREVLTPWDKERFPELSSRQGDLKERTGRLNEKLEMLAQLFPGMDTEILNDLKEAAGSMGEASGKLGEENAPGAIPPEQEAIRRLSKSQQGMQQMAQQMAMRVQAARYGYQWGYDPRPGWYYGPWVPMPTLPQPEFNRPRERGMTGIDKEEFETPSKDAYKVPKVFREKVLDALKEGVPPQYKSDVEKYFRGLTE